MLDVSAAKSASSIRDFEADVLCFKVVMLFIAASNLFSEDPKLALNCATVSKALSNLAKDAVAASTLATLTPVVPVLTSF